MKCTINNTAIHYRRLGKENAPYTILFVHGWGGSHKSLERLAALAVEEYDTITIDLPGFGLSENPPKDWGVEEYSAIVLGLIRELRLTNIVYFGHSFGGSLGIYLSSQDPHLFKKLILCNSAYKRNPAKMHAVTRIKRGVLAVFPFLKAVEKELKTLMYRFIFRRSDVMKFPHLESNFRKIITQDISDRVEKITVPTLILWGEKDTYTPVALAHELKEKIPHAQMKIFPELRHGLPLKYPELVWGEMEGFLKI